MLERISIIVLKNMQWYSVPEEYCVDKKQMPPRVNGGLKRDKWKMVTSGRCY